MTIHECPKCKIEIDVESGPSEGKGTVCLRCAAPLITVGGALTLLTPKRFEQLSESRQRLLEDMGARTIRTDRYTSWLLDCQGEISETMLNEATRLGLQPQDAIPIIVSILGALLQQAPPHIKMAAIKQLTEGIGGSVVPMSKGGDA